MNPTLIAQLTALREELVALSPDMITDEALFIDTIDGETDALDVVRSIVRAAIDAEGFAEAVRHRQVELDARKARFEARALACRRAAHACMEALDISKLPAPDFTASIRAGRPSTVITDPDLLPADFIVTTTRPDKSAIGAALKAGQDVPGAMLSNPQPTLAITKA